MTALMPPPQSPAYALVNDLREPAAAANVHRTAPDEWAREELLLAKLGARGWRRVHHFRNYYGPGWGEHVGPMLSPRALSAFSQLVDVFTFPSEVVPSVFFTDRGKHHNEIKLCLHLAEADDAQRPSHRPEPGTAHRQGIRGSRKPPHKGHPCLAMHLPEHLRMSADQRATGVHTAHKLSSQTGRLAILPFDRLPDVFLGCLSNDQTNTHGFRGSLRLTSSQDSPAPGAASKSSSRRSSSARWASVSWRLPESSAIESQRSSTNWIRSATRSDRNSCIAFMAAP